MGTTVVVALCRGDQVHIAHVGDSRAYLLHNGGLRQLTEDHSVVTRLLKAGQLTLEEARSHPFRHMITRYRGNGNAFAEISYLTWQPGDYLMLCSDGLTNMVDDAHIAELILHGGTDPPPPSPIKGLGDRRRPPLPPGKDRGEGSWNE